MAIDLNRGVVMRTHPSGVKVCMYKNDPGLYYSFNGSEVSQKFAREAGFSVASIAKERMRRERVMQATAAINAEYGHMPEGKVVHSVDGFNVVHDGAGSFNVVDPDGNVLTERPMAKTYAIKLAKSVASQEGDGAVEPEAETEEEQSDGSSA